MSADGVLLVAGQLVQVGTTVHGWPTAGPVRYEFTQTTVWLAWPDGRRVIINLPTPLGEDEWQGQPRPADWPDPPHPEAIPGYGVVTADGQLLVAGQPVQVGTTVDGRSTAGPVGYVFTQTMVWLTWNDGSRTTVNLPTPLSHDQWVAEHRRVGRPDPPHPEAIPGHGVVTADGQLSVAGQQVQVGTTLAGRPTAGPVRYEFTQTTVWLTWHDGRRAIVDLPTPLSHEQWQQHRRQAGWPVPPDPEAIPGQGVVNPAGQLSVAGQPVQLAILIAGRSTRGPIESRYNKTTLWLSWHDGRLMIVDLPTPLDDEQWQTQRSQAGLPGRPDPEAIPGYGVVDPDGVLSVAGQQVQVDTLVAGRSTAGPVEYWFNQTTVWLAWHDGRHATVNLPTPLSHDQWQQHHRQAGPPVPVSHVSSPVVTHGSAAPGLVTGSRPGGSELVVGSGLTPVTAAQQGWSQPAAPFVSDGFGDGWSIDAELAELDEFLAGYDPAGAGGGGQGRARPVWDLLAGLAGPRSAGAVVSVRPGLDTVPVVADRPLHRWFRLADPAAVRAFRVGLAPALVTQLAGSPGQILAGLQRFVDLLTELADLPKITVLLRDLGDLDEVFHHGRDVEDQPGHTLTVDSALLASGHDPARLLATIVHGVHHAEQRKLITTVLHHAATDEQLKTMYEVDEAGVAGLRAAAALLHQQNPDSARQLHHKARTTRTQIRHATQAWQAAPTPTDRSAWQAELDEQIATYTHQWNAYWQQLPAEASANGVEQVWTDLDAFTAHPLPNTPEQALRAWLRADDWHRSQLRLDLHRNELTTGPAEHLLRQHSHSQPTDDRLATHHALLVLQRHQLSDLGYRYLTQPHPRRRQAILLQPLQRFPSPPAEILTAMTTLARTTAQLSEEKADAAILDGLATILAQPPPRSRDKALKQVYHRLRQTRRFLTPTAKIDWILRLNTLATTHPHHRAAMSRLTTATVGCN